MCHIFVTKLLQQEAQKVQPLLIYLFIYILSWSHYPIRKQLKAVFGFWLDNDCMKECE